MKVLGTKQYQQMTFKLLPICNQFKGILGDVPKNFICIVYGEGGDGKTEYCVQLAKYLTGFGSVAWLSYEQAHGYDLQKAINRNKMEEVSGKIFWIDPVANRKPGVSLLEDLHNYLRKRGSPQFIFIDSIDYTGFKFDDYKSLKEKHANKTLIFISHAESRKPKTAIGKSIYYDGQIGIHVVDFIAKPKKNRFGGTEDYIIYEKLARERNPLYFEAKVKSLNPKKTADEDETPKKTKKTP